MPKFNIYDTTPAGVDVATDEIVVRPRRRISIGWSKERYAQLGIGLQVMPGESANERMPDLGVPKNGAQIEAAPQFREHGDQRIGEVEQGIEWVTEWIDLDRHMINQLIRELRSARDQAFGRDE